MATATAVRNWYFVHKWSSLVCTVFLLLLCVTGLPLVFADELNDWFGNAPTYDQLPADTPTADLDVIVHAARVRYPDQIVTSVYLDDDDPAVVVEMAPSWKAVEDTPDAAHALTYDSRTGRLVQESGNSLAPINTFIELMLRLHIDLFAGLPGMLFLGLMGLLFITATVSGVMLYGPFMKRLEFGTVRVQKSPRLRWLDVHNLLGITTVMWVLVVGFTGTMNEISTPLFNYWQRTHVQPALRAGNAGQAESVPLDVRATSLQSAVNAVRKALPQDIVVSILFPGHRYSGPEHFFAWTKGATPLTSRLLTPVLVNARSGTLTAIIAMPWYLRAIELSRPLHFGDYGAAPLKIIWGLLDLVTLFILGTGLYLWFARRRMHDRRVAQLAAAAQAQALHSPERSSGIAT